MEKSHPTAEMSDQLMQETAESDRQTLERFIQEISSRNRAALAQFMQEMNEQNWKILKKFTKDLSTQTDSSNLTAEYTKELHLLSERLIDKLKRDMEIERYRHMPWEQFIELTYGSLADDPIEWDESFRSQEAAQHLEQLAKQQGIEIDELLQDMIERYIADEQWGSLADMAQNARQAGLASTQPVDTAARSREILNAEYADDLKRRRVK